MNASNSIHPIMQPHLECGSDESYVVIICYLCIVAVRGVSVFYMEFPGCK